MTDIQDEKNSETTNPEQIIEDLGGCGKYQMRMNIVCHLMKLPVCWSVMGYFIVSKTPDFWCASDINSNVTNGMTFNNTNYDAHKACLSIDGTKCTKFRFDNSLRTIISEFDLVCDYAFAASTIMSIQNAGSIVGTMVTGHIADLVGRKLPIFISILVIIAAELMSLAGGGWIMIATSRFIIGVASGAFVTVIYNLMGEFTSARHRTWVIGFPSWSLETAAFCLLAWLVPDWRYMNLATAIVGVPFLFTWWIVPESFRWYLAHDKQKKAEKILEAIAAYNNKPPVELKQLEDIANEGESRKDQHYSILDLFRNKQLLRVTLLLSVIWFSHGFIYIGISYSIRKMSGNIFLNLFLFSMVGVPAKAIAMWAQNRFGRKATTLVWFGLTIVACGGLGVVQHFVSDTTMRGSLTQGLSLAAYLFVVALWAPVQTLAVELYPTVVRNIGFGTVTVVGSIGTLISPQFDYLGDLKGVPGLLYIACGVTAAFSFLASFGLTETKDACLDDTLPLIRHGKQTSYS